MLLLTSSCCMCSNELIIDDATSMMGKLGLLRRLGTTTINKAALFKNKLMWIYSSQTFNHPKECNYIHLLPLLCACCKLGLAATAQRCYPFTLITGAVQIVNSDTQLDLLLLHYTYLDMSAFILAYMQCPIFKHLLPNNPLILIKFA